MFVLLLEYLAPLERIDELLAEHRRYLDEHYADGTFLLSGRQVPRTGGMILAAGDDRDRIAAITERDPFVVHGAARYSIVQVEPSRFAPSLAAVSDHLR